jgi:hypothetical protein
MHVDDARNRGLKGRNEFLTTDFLDIQRENHVFDEVIGVHPRFRSPSPDSAIGEFC